jgi:hypothetical protein
VRHNSKLPRTRAIVTRLVQLIVGTGSLTGPHECCSVYFTGEWTDFKCVAVAAMLDLVLYYAFPRYAYHSCVAAILGKLYSNSLLVIFNSRIRIVGGRDWSSDSQGVSCDLELEVGRRPTSARGPVVFARPNYSQTTPEFVEGIRIDEDIWSDRESIRMTNQVSRWMCSNAKCYCS